MSRNYAAEADAKAMDDDEIREAVDHFAGLCAGQLRDDEMAVFNEACRRGLAKRSYEGALALFGLPMVRRIEP